jgi:hypothetical protein
MSVSCDCSVSGRGFCDGLITRPAESYRVWCVWLWPWNLDHEEALPHGALLRHGKKESLKLLANIGIDPWAWTSTTVLPWRPDDRAQARNYVFSLLQTKRKKRAFFYAVCLLEYCLLWIANQPEMLIVLTL